VLFAFVLVVGRQKFNIPNIFDADETRIRLNPAAFIAADAAELTIVLSD
jgi:hypothetical protein